MNTASDSERRLYVMDNVTLDEKASGSIGDDHNGEGGGTNLCIVSVRYLRGQHLNSGHVDEGAGRDALQHKAEKKGLVTLEHIHLQTHTMRAPLS